MKSSEVTLLLEAYAQGDHDAFNRLLPLIYNQLHRIAEARLRTERKDHTLNPADLVHEAYLKLVNLDRIKWQNSRHFFAIASQVMRNILVDYAVKQKSEKRGGGLQRVTLSHPDAAIEIDLEGILSVHQALQKLAKTDPRMVRVVECRYYGGLTIDETAVAIGVSEPTVNRDWNMARAWLNRELSDMKVNGNHE